MISLHLLLVSLASASEPVAGWISDYDAIRAALVADKASSAADYARNFRAVVATDSQLSAAAAAVADAGDIAAERTAFAALSRLVILRAAADSTAKVKVYYCPMVAGFGYWVQASAGLSNPYMGQSMPGCGEEVSMKRALKAAGS